MQNKIDKRFFIFGKIASELVPLNCFYEADNACHRHSMCYETVLGICLLLKETFSNGTTFKVINKYFKGAAIQIGILFRPIFHVICLRVL